MLETITKIKDPKVELARLVKTGKGREARLRMLLEGESIIQWAMAHQIEIEYVFLAASGDENLCRKYLAAQIDVFKVSDGIQKKITATNYVIPVVGVAKMPLNEGRPDPDFVIVLDNVKDHGNIGTIVRTCHAFGIRKIISSTSPFDLYQRKTIEASRGCVFSTLTEKYQSSAETIERLRKGGYQIVATSPKGSSLQALVELKAKPVALIVGNESNGVSPEFEEHADFLIQIPMSQAVESLNVGVAAGISIYELKLKQVLSMIEKQIKSTLGRELNVAAMLVQRALDVELQKVSDLNSRQVVFLMVLKCDRTMFIEDMCRQFGVLDREVDDFLGPLLEKKIITQNGKLQLTAEGEGLLAKLWFKLESIENKILTGFTDDEAGHLKRQLRQIQNNCVELINGG